VLDLARAARHHAPYFVDSLLEAARGVSVAPRPAAQGLIEPLSDRELEVLALMADGYSNAEIADRLFIAVGTVKRHINNMYGKLDVASRTQAVARARSLRLLVETEG
jgi:LuxR family maltose regulon positive regulatory protein